MASQSYLDLLQKMVDLHISKNAGYSPGEDPWNNFRMSEALGVPAWKGALIRAGDKWARIIALANNPDADQVGESIEDTLLDLASYALIVLALRKEIPPTEGPPRHIHEYGPVEVREDGTEILYCAICGGGDKDARGA